MDPDRRLTEDQADRALRDLFQATGHQSMPDGLEGRILHRIALTRRVATERPLLPAPVLVLGGAACITAFAWIAKDSSLDIHWKWPSMDLGPILGSPWLIAVGAVAIALLGLEAVLGRRTYTMQRD